MATRRLKQILALWVAVSLAIFMVACGSKKGKTVQKGSTTQTDVGQRTVPPRSSGPVPPPHQPAAPPADTGDDDERQGDDEERTGSDDSSTSLRTPKKNEKIYLTLLEERELSPEEQARLAQPVTQRSDADLRGLVYTGSANDTFVFELKAKLANKTDAAERARDLEFAKEIGLVQVHHNKPAGHVTITSLIERDGKRQHYNLVGAMSQVFTAQAGDATKAPYITAELKCMDRNNGCHNMILKFVDHKNANAKRTAYVVARSGSGWQHITYQALHLVENPEYHRLVKIFTNTGDRWMGRRSTSLDTVTEVVINTSETVNGSATFVAGLKLSVSGEYAQRFEHQRITWAGPLVSTENGATFDVSASVDYMPRNLSASKNTIDRALPYMTDFIKSTRLIENDTKGKLKLAVTIRANGPNTKEETFLLELTREPRPVHYLGLQEL